MLLDAGITVETGEHGERTFREQDLIVISPGVPFDMPQLVRARERGIPIIGEIELAYRFLKGNIVAVTGSNGKTTTTTLAGDVIAASGRDTLVGGNIGTPAITFVEAATEQTWIVLEISSFQLETVRELSAQDCRRIERHPRSSRPASQFRKLCCCEGTSLRKPDRCRLCSAECR